jgi:hypothetical protein
VVGVSVGPDPGDAEIVVADFLGEGMDRECNHNHKGRDCDELLTGRHVPGTLTTRDHPSPSASAWSLDDICHIEFVIDLTTRRTGHSA